MRKPTRQERVAKALLNPNGVSEREMVFTLNITSGRNEINEIEKKLGVIFTREWNKTADGLGQYYKYYCPNKETALKLIKFIERLALMRKGTLFTPENVKQILNQF
ncbi:hypothetical protein ACFFHT_10595 [Gallibacterium melopsittaci]|uniref:Homing endonuclease LAGLIDADG domain-containing protein n=1 Tax=Gallibacterium melopsittaci TaxID=516063 RepID=A0ABV6HYR7_9PAST